MSPETMLRASQTRILVAISAHFRFPRLKYLAEVLRAFSEYVTAAIEIVLFTNTKDAGELAILRRLSLEIFGDECPVKIEVVEGLDHPFNLTWSHKRLLADRFLGNSALEYTHFIYVEDDIRLSFQNFCYFIQFREELRPHGLVPSFLRVEFNAEEGGFASSDHAEPFRIVSRPMVTVQGVDFVNSPNPYTACFVLDRELAAEHAAGLSFSEETSRSMCRWGVRERAAMGICWENPPKPFISRLVVPVMNSAIRPQSTAWIGHIPNNYADMPGNGFGKVRLDSLMLS